MKSRPELWEITYRVAQKAANFCPHLRQILTGLKNLLTGTFCGKFVIGWLVNIPPHHNCVAIHYLVKYKSVISINILLKI